MKPTLVVLAAGMGSRYGGLKQIDPVGPNGEIILDYSIYDAIRGGFGKVVFIIRKDIEKDFKEVVSKRWEGKIEIDYVYQQLDAIPAPFTVQYIMPWADLLPRSPDRDACSFRPGSRRKRCIPGTGS